MRSRLAPVVHPTTQLSVTNVAPAGLARAYLARMGEPSWASHARTQVLTGLAGRRRGATGLLLRRVLYPRLFAAATKPVVGEDVVIRGARRIHLGSDVLIEGGVLLDVKTDDPFGLVVGDGTNLRWGCRVDTGFHGSVRMGERCIVGGELLGAAGIRFGDLVLVARGATVVSANHRWADPDVAILDQGIEAAPVEVGDDVWIATGAVLLPGITIGRGAVVAANAVVNVDVPPFAVVAGAPARVVRWRRADDVAGSVAG